MYKLPKKEKSKWIAGGLAVLMATQSIMPAIFSLFLFFSVTGGFVLNNPQPAEASNKVATYTFTGPSTAGWNTYQGKGKSFDRGGKDDSVYPDESFDSYLLEFGSGTAPTSWTQISDQNSFVGDETTDGDIAQWDTTEVTSGTYTLRLRTFDKAGNISVESRKRLTVN